MNKFLMAAAAALMLTTAACESTPPHQAPVSNNATTDTNVQMPEGSEQPR